MERNAPKELQHNGHNADTACNGGMIRPLPTLRLLQRQDARLSTTTHTTTTATAKLAPARRRGSRGCGLLTYPWATIPAADYSQSRTFHVEHSLTLFALRPTVLQRTAVWVELAPNCAIFSTDYARWRLMFTFWRIDVLRNPMPCPVASNARPARLSGYHLRVIVLYLHYLLH